MLRILALAATLLLTLSTLCAAQSARSGQRKVFDIGGTEVEVLIPPGMGVTMTPRRLRSSGEMSMFYYTFSTAGNPPAHGLRWNVYIHDTNGRMVGEDSWRDWGRWPSNSEVEGETVFEFKQKSGNKLIIILAEAESLAGVKDISEAELKRVASSAAAGSRTALPKPNYVAHAEVSARAEVSLVKRSFGAILADGAFRKYIGVAGRDVLAVADCPDKIRALAGVRYVSRAEVVGKIRGGKQVKYFECYRVYVKGRSVMVAIDYRTPLVYPNSYVMQGVRFTCNYESLNGRFILRDITMVHF
jgi:hypothetical protein